MTEFDVSICACDSVDVWSRAVALQNRVAEHVIKPPVQMSSANFPDYEGKESVCVVWRNTELTPHPRHGLHLVFRGFGTTKQQLARIQASAQAWTPSPQTLRAWSELATLSATSANSSATSANSSATSADSSATSADSSASFTHEPLLVTRYSARHLFLSFLSHAPVFSPVTNIPADLYNDAAVMLRVVERSPWHFEFASHAVRSNHQVTLAAVSRAGNTLQFACDSLRNDRSVVLAAVRQSGAALRDASEALQKDREVVKAVVSSQGSMLRQTEPQFRDDFDIVFAAVSQSGSALEHASLMLRDDERIVAKAVESTARALQYASRRLKGTPRLIIAACKHASDGFCAYGLLASTPAFSEDRDLALEALQATGGRAHRFLKSPWFDSDAAFVLEAVRLCGRALITADPLFQDDDEIVLAAVRQDGDAAEYASLRLRADKKVAIAACRQDGMALSFFCDALRRDKDVVLAAIPTYKDILMWVADKSLCDDEDVVRESVRWHGHSIKFASPRLQNSKAILCSSDVANTNYFPDAFMDDFDVTIATVKRGGDCILGQASPEMRSNKEVVVAAVSKYGKQLAYASAALKADPDVVLAALKSDPTAIRFADSCMYEKFWHIVAEALETDLRAFDADKHRMLTVAGKIMEHFDTTPFAASKLFGISIAHLVHLKCQKQEVN